MSLNKSFEQVLEEERREVVALLDTPKKRSRGASLSGSQPYVPRPISPGSSVLDAEYDTVPRHSSLPENQPRPSLPAPAQDLQDVDLLPLARSISSDLPPASAPLHKTSPGQINFAAYPPQSQHHRSLSDASGRASEYAKLAPNSTYRFSGLLASGGNALPKRSASGGKKVLPSSLGEALRGDLSSFGPLLKPKSRSSSNAGSNSSNGSGTRRASSPRPPSILSPNSDKVMFLDDGRVIDASVAHLRLSDTNLSVSQRGLSSSPRRARRSSKESRLETDHIVQDREDVVEDSSDDDSSEEGRGRRQDAQDKIAALKNQTHSLRNTADGDSRKVAANQEHRSLFTSAVLPHTLRGKPSVHPNTSFDQSIVSTPHDSEDGGEISDIKHAQKLPMSWTPIMSNAATQRSVRTVYRGNFIQMQQEARDHQRHVRKYLVATDLSDEAAHALEWTIGTVLRDGDTLLAIYCVDEEIGPSVPGEESQTHVQAVAVAQSTRPTGSTPVLSASNGPSPFGSNIRLDSLSAGSSTSPMGRGANRAEQERHRAVQDITERVAKLLRKTKLQVKVVVEVICCKSAKHLITEVIDYINPTLVILGSRGRSALKGVILGSFSNYLVTKSSVPVMVARKKLKKHTKYKRPSTLKLANNLNNSPGMRTSNGLAHAIVD